jgi:hypothetical protein
MHRALQLMLGMWLGVAAILTSGQALALDDASICGAETARQEKLQNIPDKLLHAISLVESGRWDPDRKASFAWPWTIMAEGEGRFLPTKAAAIAEVKKLQARGVRNIDVGCMQVNLLAHDGAFRTLDEAFDPASNVGYAARFLMGLYDSTQNWATAGAYYHSQTPALAAEYKTKLISTWTAAKGRKDDRLEIAMTENRPPIGLFVSMSERGITPAVQSDVSAALARSHAETASRIIAERAEAKRIADAYRQAKLEEYRLRKVQMARG